MINLLSFPEAFLLLLETRGQCAVSPANIPLDYQLGQHESGCCDTGML